MRRVNLPNALMTVCFAKRRWRGNGAQDMMSRQVASFTGLMMVVWLAGCASTPGRYPSLAMRDFETRPPGVSEPVDPAPIPQAASSAQIAAIRAAAESAFANFTRQQPGAAAIVSRARGQSLENDTRGRAIVALADLSTQRSATYVHLGDLDQLAAQGTVDYKRTDAIDAARSEVAAMIAQQDKVLADLWAEMGL